MSEQKSFILYYEELSELVGFDGAAICAKVISMAGEDGIARISLDYLARVGNVSIDTIRRLLFRLQVLGYIEYTANRGRGHLTTFKKGRNLLPFVPDKRSQNTLIKGSNLPPYYKTIKKDSLETRTRVRETKQTKKNSSMQGDTPCDPRIMELFEQFWQSFFFGSYAQYEQEQAAYKERAAAVWRLMTPTAQAACLQQVRNGKRYDKTHFVLYYLQKYKEPLPIWKNGDDDLTAELVGRCVKIRYKGELCYCLPKDFERCKAAGAVEFKPTQQ